MEYIDKMKSQIDKLKLATEQLNIKELQLNELNCKLKEKKDKIDLYREQIEEEDYNNFIQLNNTVNKCLNVKTLSNQDQFVVRKINLIKDIMKLKSKEINNIKAKIDKRSIDFNKKYAHLTETEKTMFDILYNRIINDCKTCNNSSMKFSSKKLQTIYSEIINDKNDKVTNATNIDNIIGHKLSKLNISNIISDLHSKTVSSSIELNSSYTTNNKCNLRDNFLRMIRQNKMKNSLQKEEDNSLYHSRSMTFSSSMQRTHKYKSPYNCNTPKNKKTKKPINITEIGGNNCCAKLYKNYKENIEYYKQKKRSLSENAKKKKQINSN